MRLDREQQRTPPTRDGVSGPSIPDCPCAPDDPCPCFPELARPEPKYEVRASIQAILATGFIPRGGVA